NIKTAQHMTGTLRRNHRHIDVRWRHDLRIVQAKTMSRQQQFARSQAGPNITLKYLAMMLIRDKNHNDIGLLSCIGGSQHTQPITLSLSTTLAANRQTDKHITTAIIQVQKM